MSEENGITNERISKVSITEQMKTAYIDYSMSVIVSRALPDVRDGLKPVHRRVLFGMNELGLASNKSFKKSARIVGEVLGKYHPHGDSSVYLSMVRMAQYWSLRYPLVHGKGNYGSMDGDSPAAMRYTEAKLNKIAEELLRDIEKDTVDFKFNFDNTIQEPTVLPTRIPNLLVNGASGIAVGMATNMLPHNLTEVIDACIALNDNPSIPDEELIQYVKGPDFPTGATIYGYKGIKDAYLTGRGRVVVRAKTNIRETKSGKEQILVNELPYMVNKKELIEKIADLVNSGKLTGISNINDESGRDGMRIAIDVKRDAIPNVVLNKLFKYTALQSSYGINNICLVKGRPKLLNLKQLIANFVEFREEVVIRRTKFDLKKAEERAHILEGLLKALDNIDAIIKLIRGSKTPDEAKTELMKQYDFTEIQAKAILDMRLQKLTNLESSKIENELAELKELIAYLNKILNDEPFRKGVIKEELQEVKDKYGDERKTDIVFDEEEFNPEDFYANDEMLITISHLGYIKRTPLKEYQAQNRGGKGSKGSSTRDKDFLEHMFVATMHNTVLLFTEKGKCFWQKVYELPEGGKNSKGRAIQNILNIEQDDSVKAFINVKSLKEADYLASHYIVMATQNGIVKKTSLKEYSNPRANGVNAITIKDNDQLLEAKLTDGKQDIILGVKSGKAIRFPEDTIRSIGRTGSGVKGVSLSDNEDQVVGMVCANPEESVDILVVSAKGYGKRTSLEDYRITNRGGKGVKTLNVTDKTGELVAIKQVADDQDIIIINKSGIVIRISADNVRSSGRATQGVKLIDLRGKDAIAAVTCVTADDEEDTQEVPEGEGAENTEVATEAPEQETSTAD